MIDLRLVRDDPDRVRASQRARREDPATVDALLEADERRRAAVATADDLRAEQKALGRKVGKAAPDDRHTLLEHAKHLADEVKAAEAEQAQADEALRAAHRAMRPCPHARSRTRAPSRSGTTSNRANATGSTSGSAVQSWYQLANSSYRGDGRCSPVRRQHSMRAAPSATYRTGWR